MGSMLILYDYNPMIHCADAGRKMPMFPECDYAAHTQNSKPLLEKLWNIIKYLTMTLYLCWKITRLVTDECPLTEIK